MEIKATLNKPYADKQRADFIVENNHKLGYEIQETEDALLAVYNEPTAKETAQEKIEELKAQLVASDYVVLKITEALDEAEKTDLLEKYADVLKSRREARVEINKLSREYGV